MDQSSILRACDTGGVVAWDCSREGPFLKGHLTSGSATACLCHGWLVKAKEEGGNQSWYLRLQKSWTLAKPCFHTFLHKREVEKALSLQ